MSMPRVGSSSIKISGLVSSQRPKITFCWLPPDSEPMRVLWAGVFTRMASITHCVSSFIFLLFKKPDFS